MTYMDDKTLAKWLREELSSYGRDYYDRDDVGEAITALVALARGLLDCHEAKCDGRPGHTCKYLERGRAVLGAQP